MDSSQAIHQQPGPMLFCAKHQRVMCLVGEGRSQLAFLQLRIGDGYHYGLSYHIVQLHANEFVVAVHTGVRDAANMRKQH